MGEALRFVACGCLRVAELARFLDGFLAPAASHHKIDHTCARQVERNDGVFGQAKRAKAYDEAVVDVYLERAITVLIAVE